MSFDQKATCVYCKKAITRTAKSGAAWVAPEIDVWHQTLCYHKDNPNSYHYPVEESRNGR